MKIIISLNKTKIQLKSLRDQHFSLVTHYLKQAEHKTRITSVNQIRDILNDSQVQVNLQRVKNKQQPHQYLVFANPMLDKQKEIGTFRVEQLESLYNIQNVKRDGEVKIYTTIFSDLSDLLPIELIEPIILNKKQKQKLVKPDLKPSNQLNSVLDNSDLKISYLDQKRNNIQQNLRLARLHNQNVDSKVLDVIIDSDDSSSTNHADNENNSKCIELHPTSNDVMSSNESQVPPMACLKATKHQIPCKKSCFFASLNQIRNTNVTILRKELSIHNHPQNFENKALSIKSNSRFVDHQGLRKILIDHYMFCHDFKETPASLTQNIKDELSDDEFCSS